MNLVGLRPRRRDVDLADVTLETPTMIDDVAGLALLVHLHVRGVIASRRLKRTWLEEIATSGRPRSV